MVLFRRSSKHAKNTRKTYNQFDDEHYFARLANQVTDVILELDDNGQLVFTNASFEALPAPRQALIRQHLNELSQQQQPSQLSHLFRAKFLSRDTRLTVILTPWQSLVSPLETTLRDLQENSQQAQSFYHSAVKTISDHVGWKYAVITRFLSATQVEILAFWNGDQWGDEGQYELTGKPCEVVAKTERFTLFTDSQSSFPDDAMLNGLGVKTYAGLVYRGSDNQPLGHVMIMHDEADIDVGFAEQVLSVVTLALSSHFELHGITQYLRNVETEAYQDPLTSLGNRLAFDNAMQDLQTQCQEQQPDTMLMMVDLDGLKSVNDAYGHPVGDRLLNLFGYELSRLGRNSDQTFRLGGDEFVVLFEGTSSSSSGAILQRLEHAMAGIRDLVEHPVDASAGFCHIADVNYDVHELLRVADERMYRVKKAKKRELAAH